MYSVLFLTPNDTGTSSNILHSKSDMLQHVGNLLDIWGLGHMNYESMLDENFIIRNTYRFYLSGSGYSLIVTKISD